jgi:MFS family permease
MVSDLKTFLGSLGCFCFTISERMPAGPTTKSGQINTVTPRGGSSLSPFAHRVFAILWAATVVSNIGTWMQNAAAGWLMTGLNPDPLIVALVQVATTLPMFLLGLPAGALADILDRRLLLIAVQITLTLLTAGFGLIVDLNLVTPGLLLGFTFFWRGCCPNRACLASHRATARAARRPS